MKLSLRSLIAAAMLVSCSAMMAQDDPEYRMEIGAGLVLTTYEGDFNGAIEAASALKPVGILNLSFSFQVIPLSAEA